MGIQAIETVYKGYRFRSRLEARWAVFFDEYGVDWRYEDQGYELPCGRYLPDFFLPEQDGTPGMFVEVKPGPNPEYIPPKVYWAGRMGAHSCRPFNHQHDGGLNTKLVTFNDVPILYTGPWSYSGRHGEAWEVHNSLASALHYKPHDTDLIKRKIYARALEGIKDCDIFLAVLSDLEAFGTLVELGIAKGLGKKIAVGFFETEMAEYPACYEVAHPELWFALEAADICFGGDIERIKTCFANWILSEHPEPKEQQKMRRLSSMAQVPGMVVYGDPLDAREFNYRMFNSRGYGTDTVVLRSGRADGPATAARQARFEHGQSGAPYVMA